MKTVITHFYNEEYLLPWWLKHHREIFDFGILINYNSSDQSVDIIKELCPHWQIIDTTNEFFDARKCDQDVEFCERQLHGWRMALTVTEFLVGDVNKLTIDSPARVQWYIPGIRFTGWDTNKEFDTTKPLWEQHTMGISYHDNPTAHQCRSLHNFNDIKYPVGRHFTPYNTEDALIFHYAHTLIGPKMFDRRLQIQHKVSPEDKAEKLGTHHYADGTLNIDNLKHMHDSWISIGERDCSQYIGKVTG